MPIPVGSLQFGEIDAKNELFQQTRYGSSVFQKSFQIPPNVNLDDLMMGARFFISGQKGCGKTSLLLFIRQKLDDLGAESQTILFKSGLNETERSMLAQGQKIEIIQTQEKIEIQYDYTPNWLWFIYKSFIRLIDKNKVSEGHEYVSDLKRIVGVQSELHVSTFADLSLTRIKAAMKAAFAIGGFSSGISVDVEGLKAARDDRQIMEVVEICERYLPKIKMHPRSRCLLFFDELELFWNRPDQRERDRFLIRDLLQSVARANRSLGVHSASFVAYACVRSEVLQEINRVGPEIVRDITDFGVAVNWDVRLSDEAEQPILAIVEAKIAQSEIETDESPSADVWSTYFPQTLYKVSVKRHLLNVAMFKPRHIIARLTLARNYNSKALRLEDNAFENTALDFSQTVWREMEEELLGAYNSKIVSNIKTLLTGYKTHFTLIDLEQRVDRLSHIDASLLDGLATKAELLEVCRSLYRIGALGNEFRTGHQGRRRDRWSFRGYPDPLVDEQFVVHESLRKVLQLSYTR